MKKTILLFTAILGLIGFFSIANAQTPDLSQESIVSFDSNITVNTDNSVDVVETIIYNTGQQERHGMYRDIKRRSSQGRIMSIQNITVSDEKNNPYIFEVSNSSKTTRIKIGDPNQTFIGQKTYIIKYHATRAVAQLKGIDEIYWNVNGNDWLIPVYEATASVVLPSGAKMTQSACYYGPEGSANQCKLISSINNIYKFESPVALYAQEGLTIAVGFPKDIINAYSSYDKLLNFFEVYWPWFLSAILPILTLIFSLIYWRIKWRDPRGTGIIVPQYDIPDELTPMEVIGIIKDNIGAKDISAEIVYLATRGYLKIRQLEKTSTAIFGSANQGYELIKLKDFFDLPNSFDQKLLQSLFASKETVKLSDLENVFYKDADDIIKLVPVALFDKGYYKNLGRLKNRGIRLVIILFVFIVSMSFARNYIPIIIGVFLSVIVYAIVSYFSPVKSEKGVATKEYILGLKDYLRIAEKDRLNFHNAPEKKPEIFEKLLPYAMVLGVVDIWAKEFEGIYTAPPSWYSGTEGAAFSAVAFGHSINNFSSFASSSLASSPSSGGSGGGGFSGGGGGGGGGGGW